MPLPPAADLIALVQRGGPEVLGAYAPGDATRATIKPVLATDQSVVPFVRPGTRVQNRV